MFKKLFLFSGLCISLLLVLNCIGNSIVDFIQIPTASGDAEAHSMLLSHAIWYLIVGLLSLGALIPATIMAITRIKNGNTLIVPSILLAGSSFILLLAMTIIGGQLTARIVGANLKEIEAYNTARAAYESVKNKNRIQIVGANIAVRIIGYIFSFFSPLTACALSVLSFFDFDKNVTSKAEAPKKAKANNGSVNLERMKELKDLYDSGALDEEEFKELKRKELNIL